MLSIRNLGILALSYTGLSLLFFSKPLLQGQPFLIGDMDTLFYPQAKFFSESIRSGEFPFWNPLVFCGVPFFSEPRSFVFYPLYWLFVPFQGSQTIWVVLSLHLTIAGIGTALLVSSSVKSGRWASFCGGIVYAFSGFFCFKMEHLDQVMTCAWIPWVLWGATRFLESPTRGRFVLFSIFYSLPLLTGAMETMAYLSIALVGLIAANAFIRPSENNKKKIKIGLLAFTAMAIGAGLSGLQLIPTLEMFRYSARWAGFEIGHAGWESMPIWRAFSETILPNIWDYKVVNGEYLPVPLPTGFTGYVGPVAILFAVFASIKHWKEPTIRSWALLAIVALVLSFGRHTPIYRLLYYLGLSPFRHPTHFKILTILSIAVLTAAGVQSFLNPSERKSNVFFQRPLIYCVMVLALSTTLIMLFGFEKFIPFKIDKFAKLIATDLCFTGLALAIGLAATTVDSLKVRKGLFACSIALPLIAFAREAPIWNPEPLSDHRIEILNSLSNEIKSSLGPYRTFNDHCIDLRVHRSMPYRLPDVYGYESGLMPLRRYEELKQQMSADSHLANTLGRRLIDLLGAKYQVRDAPIKDESLRLLHHFNPYYVYENAYARSRVSFATTGRVLSDKETLQVMSKGEWDPGNEVILNDHSEFYGTPNRVETSSPSVVLVSESNNQVVCQVRAPNKGFLVLSDLYYPGWKVAVDGQPASLLRANFLFRAVGVEAGQHQIKFTFQSESFSAGISLTMICVLLLALVLSWNKKS